MNPVPTNSLEVAMPGSVANSDQPTGHGPTVKDASPGHLDEGVHLAREEAAPNACVWEVYRETMARADTAMLDSWNKSLDILLIFAGLFSAAIVAFIKESYKSLQPDYTEYAAKFLHAAAERNPAIKSRVVLLPGVDPFELPDTFHPSPMQHWANGPWLASLAFCLTVVALLCILVKHWLDEYHDRTTRSVPSHRDWARRRVILYQRLNVYHVPALIALQPLLLRASLFLYFASLVLFLMDGAIATKLLSAISATLCTTSPWTPLPMRGWLPSIGILIAGRSPRVFNRLFAGARLGLPMPSSSMGGPPDEIHMPKLLVATSIPKDNSIETHVGVPKSVSLTCLLPTSLATDSLISTNWRFLAGRDLTYRVYDITPRPLEYGGLSDVHSALWCSVGM